jgi:hypothetical protein
VHGIPSPYRELARMFTPDGERTLGESLDALDHVRYGGFGVREGALPVGVVWADHACHVERSCRREERAGRASLLPSLTAQPATPSVRATRCGSRAPVG